MTLVHGHGHVDREYSRPIELKAFPVRAINSFTQRFTNPIQNSVVAPLYLVAMNAFQRRGSLATCC